jgi:hypothetical protein
MIVASRVLQLLSKHSKTTPRCHVAAICASHQRCLLTTDCGGGIGLHNVKDRKSLILFITILPRLFLWDFGKLGF